MSTTSGIGGEKRESTGDYTKKVGLFAAKVIAINPSEKDYKEILNITLPEDSVATNYLGEKNGNTTLRLDIWLEEVGKKLEEGERANRFKVNFFLEDKVRMNKDETKTQFINTIGSCSWGAEESDLPTWFVARDYRESHSGEEEMYDFIRTWLSNLDFRKEATNINLNWKKLMKGDVRELTEQIDGEWANSFVAMAIVVVKEKEGEIKEYQNVWNRGFLPLYSLKNFNLTDYSDGKVIENLMSKIPKDLKIHEKFVLKILGEYGCKDFFVIKGLQDYNPAENFAASDEVLDEEESADY
jgi:hypothetical protein